MKKIIFALLTGFLLALAWPTYGLPFLLFFAFVPLLYAEFKIRTQAQKKQGWKVFGLAYLSFLIWNSISTYWLYFSTPAGAIFAILANTLLMTLVFFVYHKVARRTNFTVSAVFLTCLWMCFEYLHLHWQFSWPWLNLGNGFSEYPQWIQWYEYTGTFGGTLWVWLTNILAFKTLLLYLQHRQKDILYRGLLKIILLIGLPIGISYLIWINYSDEPAQKSIEVLALQPNINPYTEKYNTNDVKIGVLLNKMVTEHITDSTALVLAPETVFADGTNRSNFAHSVASRFSNRIITTYPYTSFLAGISFYDLIRDEGEVAPQSNQVKPGLWVNYYNSAFMVSPNRPLQVYHKSKLVVGVETFPFQDVLKPLLGNIMIDLGGTVAQLTTQKNRETFTFADSLKTAPIICYESVYGEYVTGYVKNGAQFLSIITNDAWWGNTQGHKQHLSYARLRAIETRRDVVQSANNGTSAIINQKGEVLQRTDYAVRAVLKGEVHLNTAKTFYVRFGDYIARLAQFMAAFIFLFAYFRKQKENLR